MDSSGIWLTDPYSHTPRKIVRDESRSSVAGSLVAPLSLNGFQHSDLDNASLDLVALFLIKAKKKLTPLAQGRLCLKQRMRTNLHAISYNSALQSF